MNTNHDTQIRARLLAFSRGAISAAQNEAQEIVSEYLREQGTKPTCHALRKARLTILENLSMGALLAHAKLDPDNDYPNLTWKPRA